MSSPCNEISPIIIFDTTLRDGDQAPGNAMSAREKVRITEALESMGVDVIEAGYPKSSPGELQAVTEIARLLNQSVIAVAARATDTDIRLAWKSLKHARRPRIHTYISTSPLHMKFKLGMSSSEVIHAIKHSVGLARSQCPDVKWSAEDATRSNQDFLC